ncbi:DUF1905 domain-containing protein [Cellulosimicrobium marinum]|uniref:DUF1905 domain-containing protein n=1 Tax=Cellulosimicrobium marinum TaxID=1638992 RepID=UPI001E30014F|nr:DUF1905 domain-containing protein [Cellulosimicrobium marinum]MCB7135374.1 DUF1905 domain-containing protein [Cellulosimicrobium marinum]
MGTTGEARASAGTRYEFRAELWRWEARTDSWVFLALPEDVSDEIADLPLLPAGFGSVKVEVTLGGSRWSTSIFPDAGRKTYVLPVKAAVRRAERVDVGDVVTVRVTTVG